MASTTTTNPSFVYGSKIDQGLRLSGFFFDISPVERGFPLVNAVNKKFINSTEYKRKHDEFL